MFMASVSVCSKELVSLSQGHKAVMPLNALYVSIKITGHCFDAAKKKKSFVEWILRAIYSLKRWSRDDWLLISVLQVWVFFVKKIKGIIVFMNVAL